jgi:type III restriction enzyme
MKKDISIPEITPLLGRKKSLQEEIASIDVMAFNINTLPFKSKEIEETKTFIYEGYDILSKEKLLEREYQIPSAQTAEEVLGYYSKIIAQNIKLPSQFAAIVPKVREFFEKKAFGKSVDLDNAEAIQAMSSKLAHFVVVKEFEKALREKVVEERIPELVNAGRNLSETQPFPTSRKVLEAQDTIFNFVVCDNDFEENFARFLGKAEDVDAFAKLPEQFNFCIRYVDSLANLRNYFPDYVVRLDDGAHWLIETKGREDIEVKMKDNAAVNWCKSATELTGVNWRYLKVLQKDFEQLHPSDFEGLQVGLQPVGLFD